MKKALQSVVSSREQSPHDRPAALLPSEHVDEEYLQLYLKDRMSRELSAVIDVHLGSCQSCAGKLAEQDKCLWYLANLGSEERVREDGEMRRQPRYATNEPATLQVLAPFSVAVWDVRIVDVSEGGLRVFTPHSRSEERRVGKECRL